MILRFLTKCRCIQSRASIIHQHIFIQRQERNLSDVQVQPHSVLRKTVHFNENNLPVRPSEIECFLKAKKISFEKGFTCWHCLWPASASTPKKKEFYVNMRTGLFISYEQRISGSWSTFQDLILALKDIRFEPKHETPSDVFLPDHQYEELNKVFNDATKVAELPRDEFTVLCKTFKLKGLLQETFSLFDVRVNEDRNSLLFPLYDPMRKLSGIKKVTTNGENTYDESFTPGHSMLSIFGSVAKGIQRDQSQVVLAGSVLDAMAITQETNIMAVALPRRNWPMPLEILPWFEKFSKISLWLGSSLTDWVLTKTLSEKLGMERCFFIRSSNFSLSALESLQSGHSILKNLLNAEALSHKSITTFHSLKADILRELCHSDEVSGVKWTRFPSLNKLLKGHRRGELTIFTGPTGCGKTTFMSEYSLDLCKQGVITLWGSFEIHNIRLAKLMITQFSLTPLENNLDQFEAWSEKFEQLPLFFMTLHGQHNIHQVLQVMAHAVYVHDIQHVIVDNLQFMMGMNAASDRFHRQDLIVSEFRKFATTHNCHISLVMHPRKENDTDELTNNSISGGAKASQEADNILILQDRKQTNIKYRKYIQVTKNRFDGDIGAFPIEFDKMTKSFVPKKRARKEPPVDDERSKS